MPSQYIEYLTRINFHVAISCYFIAATVKITQEPNPARSGGKVTLTCTGTDMDDNDDLQWKASDESDINKHTAGVTKTTEDQDSVTMEVDLSSFHGRTVSCVVEGKNKTLMTYKICGKYVHASITYTLWYSCCWSTI